MLRFLEILLNHIWDRKRIYDVVFVGTKKNKDHNLEMD